MRLIEVLKGLDDMMDLGAIDNGLEIAGLTCDSRAVRPGYLFAALPGVKADGRDFIQAAVEKGAVCVLGPVPTQADVPVIEAGNPRLALAKIAANFYPRQPNTIAAVTGTNGKTSSCAFLRQIWEQTGLKAASLGTIGVQGAGFDEPGGLTTPDSVKLHETLQRICDAGVDHLAMEASSHGLEQYRLDGVRVRAAAFTNLTRDHLDYHGTMGGYLAAKMRLFLEIVEPGGLAVVNADVPQAQDVIAAAKKRGLEVMTYGRAGSAVRILERQALAAAQRLSIMVGDRNFNVEIPVAGLFQAENALCALALAVGLGLDVDEAVEALRHLQGVPGRMELIAQINGAAVYLDYAHTPNAFETVLKSLRPHTKNELSIVFGCGGDRDAGKRPEMGGIADELADKVFVTDDNPRSEDPAQIRSEILATAVGAQEIADRGAAIEAAVRALKPGDALVITGKGHDKGQIVGGDVLPFSDVAAINAAIDACRSDTANGEATA